MGQVIADVAKHAATKDGKSGIPIVEKDAMRQFPERSGQNNKQSRGHDEPILIHGDVMVDSVQQEMEGDPNAIVGQVPGDN